MKTIKITDEQYDAMKKLGLLKDETEEEENRYSMTEGMYYWYIDFNRIFCNNEDELISCICNDSYKKDDSLFLLNSDYGVVFTAENDAKEYLKELRVINKIKSFMEEDRKIYNDLDNHLHHNDVYYLMYNELSDKITIESIHSSSIIITPYWFYNITYLYKLLGMIDHEDLKRYYFHRK